MKRMIILLLTLFLLGCQAATTELSEPTGQHVVVIEGSSDEKAFDNDVRLSAEGFEAEKITIKQNEGVTIHVVDSDVDGHYLTLHGDRISQREFVTGDKVFVFSEKGRFKITDETSKQTLNVIVE